jgi:hypothetical protein
MEGYSSHSRKYYVIFRKSGLKDWRLTWLQPNFQHVFIARKSDYGYFWIITNPKGGNVITEIESLKDENGEDVTIRDMFPDDIILEYQSKVHERMQIAIVVMSCVEIVKMMLGIRKWWIVTPYQLYKYIIKAKGE